VRPGPGWVEIGGGLHAGLSTPLRFGRDEKAVGSFDRDEKAVGSFDRDEKAVGSFDRDEKAVGSSG
jgi:hypothetical protein